MAAVFASRRRHTMLEAVTSAAAALAVGGCCTWRLASFLQLSILMAAAVAPTTSVLRAASVAGSWQDRVRAIGSAFAGAVIALVASALLVVIVAAALGAPLSWHGIHASANLGLLLGTLTTVPCGAAFGFDPLLWSAAIQNRLRKAAHRRPVRRAAGAIAGAWLAAGLLPMDWGASWLEYPRPLLVGAATGFNAVLLLQLLHVPYFAQ